MQYVAATTEYFDSVDYIKRYAFFGAWAQNPDGFATDHSACEPSIIARPVYLV